MGTSFYISQLPSGSISALLVSVKDCVFLELLELQYQLSHNTEAELSHGFGAMTPKV